MKNISHIINIITYKLPFKLSNQIYNEYQNRLKEAVFLVDNYLTYKDLKDHLKTIELFLAISIFYKRVLTNFNGAVKFHKVIEKKVKIDVIKIGSFNFTGDEKNKLLAVILNFQEILDKYSIPISLFEYHETSEFLNKLIGYKTIIEYNNSKDYE